MSLYVCTRSYVSPMIEMAIFSITIVITSVYTRKSTVSSNEPKYVSCSKSPRSSAYVDQTSSLSAPGVELGAIISATPKRKT